MDDHTLMGIYTDTLFTYDACGRMVTTNEPREEARHPAPRLFLGRAIGGHIMRLGHAVPDAEARRLAGIIEGQPVLGTVPFSPTTLDAVKEALGQQAPVTREGGGPTYRFPESLPRPREAIRLTDANVEVVRDTYPWLYAELADWQPCFAVVRDGVGVSICFSARVGSMAAAAGVETLPDFRGHGYAAAVTAAWGASVLAAGRIPLYSTWWENLTSQGVARRIGLIMFGADATWR